MRSDFTFRLYTSTCIHVIISCQLVRWFFQFLYRLHTVYEYSTRAMYCNSVLRISYFRHRCSIRSCVMVRVYRAQILHGAGVDCAVRVVSGRRVPVAGVSEQQRATAQMARPFGHCGTHDVRHARAALLVCALSIRVYRRTAHRAIVLCSRCSVGLLGDCIMTTRQQCGLVRGYFHDDAFLCSQVLYYTVHTSYEACLIVK